MRRWSKLNRGDKSDLFGGSENFERRLFMKKKPHALVCAMSLALVGLASLPTTSRAETGSVRVVFTKGGLLSAAAAAAAF
jgi:hypothetical protein